MIPVDPDRFEGEPDGQDTAGFSSQTPDAGSISNRARAVAEELNNLFQITLGAGTHLKDVWPSPPVPPEVDDIQKASRRGARLVRELRELEEN